MHFSAIKKHRILDSLWVTLEKRRTWGGPLTLILSYMSYKSKHNIQLKCIVEFCKKQQFFWVTLQEATINTFFFCQITLQVNKITMNVQNQIYKPEPKLHLNFTSNPVSLDWKNIITSNWTNLSLLQQSIKN